MISPHELVLIGRAIYGAHWKTPMAADLQVNDRTVERWERQGAPDTIATELLQAYTEKIGHLGQAMEIIEAACERITGTKKESWT